MSDTNNLNVKFNKGDVFIRPKRTFLLRWNPAISSFKMEYYKDALAKFGNSFAMDWSVWDWEHAAKGDLYFMLRVGECENPGILFWGEFLTDPYEGDSWSGSGKRIHYVDISCFDCVDAETGVGLPLHLLENEFPQIDWRKGHSGELLPKEVSDRLMSHWQHRSE